MLSFVIPSSGLTINKSKVNFAVMAFLFIVINKLVTINTCWCLKFRLCSGFEAIYQQVLL